MVKQVHLRMTIKTEEKAEPKSTVRHAISVQTFSVQKCASKYIPVIKHINTY